MIAEPALFVPAMLASRYGCILFADSDPAAAPDQSSFYPVSGLRTTAAFFGTLKFVSVVSVCNPSRIGERFAILNFP